MITENNNTIEAKIRASKFYNMYKLYCEKNNQSILSNTKFGMIMKKFTEKIRTNGYVYIIKVIKIIKIENKNQIIENKNQIIENKNQIIENKNQIIGEFINHLKTKHFDKISFNKLYDYYLEYIKLNNLCNLNNEKIICKLQFAKIMSKRFIREKIDGLTYYNL